MGEHIIIGAGLSGAAAAWQLASRGELVTVLERTTPGNREGSSHGSARIFRYAYQDQYFADLVVRSKLGWDELERQSGKQLITPTGAIDHGEMRRPEVLIRVMENAGVEHELLSAAKAQARWPQFHFDTDVLWHPGAGVFDAITSVETMLELAQATGNARVLTDWEVATVERLASGGFTVLSSTGARVEGNRIITAAGGWLPVLLGNLALPESFVSRFPQLQIRQEQAFHMPYRDTDFAGNAYPDWPTFIHKSNTIETYGLPGGRDAGFRGQKMAQFNGGSILSSALERDGQIRPEMRAKIIDYATRYLPGVLPEPYAETTCLFTNTPSEGFVVDESDGVVIVAACSGHGGKFAPLLGELAADLATGIGGVPDEFRLAAHAGKTQW